MAVLVLLVAASALWVFDSEGHRRSRLTAQATQVGEAQAQELKAALERNLTVLEIAAALVQQGGGDVPRFADIGAQLLRSRPGVRALGLLPQGVVTQVVPDSYNARVLGMDVLGGPSPHPDAVQAVRDQALVVSAPAPLPIGHQGLVAHQPVYLAAEEGGRPVSGAWCAQRWT